MHLTWDSRQAGPEVAFVALPGEAMHGNRFVEAALEAGAPFVLTDLDVPRAVRVADAREALFAWARRERAKNALVVGITGSVGKTTAKNYAAAALEAAYMPVFNTLPAIACFLIEHGAGAAPLVVEMGIDRVGEMTELMGLVSPDVGVVTAVGAAHLEALGTVENVAREKGLILKAPRALAGPQAASFYPGVPSYGFENATLPEETLPEEKLPRGTLSGEKLHLDGEGARFGYQGVRVSLPRAARVQAEAALLGLILAQDMGLDLEKAAERMANVEVPGGRYRVLPGAVTIIDDTYNASPLSMFAALDALATHTPGTGGRRISVLGRMLELGASEARLHAEVGEYAAERAEVSYGVGQFAAELGERAYRSVPELLEALLAEVRAGDVVLVKASRGISWTPERRAAEGVGLETVVAALLEERERL